MSPGARAEVDEVEDTSSSGDGGRNVFFVREMRGFAQRRGGRGGVSCDAALRLISTGVTDRTGTAAAIPPGSPRLCASIVLPFDLWARCRKSSPQPRLGSLAALAARNNWKIPACAGTTMGQGGWIGRLGRDALWGGATGRAWVEAIGAGARRTAGPVFRRPIGHLRCRRSNTLSRSRHSRYAAAACRGRAR